MMSEKTLAKLSLGKGRAGAIAPTPEGATPAVTASAPLIGSTAVAPAPYPFEI